MFGWIKRAFGGRKPEAKKASPHRSQAGGVKPYVGQTFEVDDPEEARLRIAEMAFQTGGIVMGSANWDEETGKGTIRVESVSPSTAPIPRDEPVDHGHSHHSHDHGSSDCSGGDSGGGDCGGGSD